MDYKRYRKETFARVNQFDMAFKPWKKWQDVKLSDANPCNVCSTYKDYEEVALYGNIAERQYAELPKGCPCVYKLYWEMECLEKLKWYEDNDERLKKKDG